MRQSGMSRNHLLVLAALVAAIVPSHAASYKGSTHMTRSHSSSSASPRVQRLTPVLVVDAVEPCIGFWVERFGFTAENQVPGPDGKLVFASVVKGDIEVMYQTRASVLAERPDAGPELTGHSTALFIKVENLDEVERAIQGVPLVKARHKTFYGSTELYVREPGGNTVGFAQF
jgi:uncharacterized glyoxalase superfamily protein PhnB